MRGRGLSSATCDAGGMLTSCAFAGGEDDGGAWTCLSSRFTGGCRCDEGGIREEACVVAERVEAASVGCRWGAARWLVWSSCAGLTHGTPLSVLAPSTPPLPPRGGVPALAFDVAVGGILRRSDAFSGVSLPRSLFLMLL